MLRGDKSGLEEKSLLLLLLPLVGCVLRQGLAGLEFILACLQLSLQLLELCLVRVSLCGFRGRSIQLLLCCRQLCRQIVNLSLLVFKKSLSEQCGIEVAARLVLELLNFLLERIDLRLVLFGSLLVCIDLSN